VLATILSTLQTYLNFGSLSEKHRAAGAKYASLRRGFEVSLLELNRVKAGEDGEMLEQVKALMASLDEAAVKSPTLPDPEWTAARKEYERERSTGNLLDRRGGG
jgi:hypothetical protein